MRHAPIVAPPQSAGRRVGGDQVLTRVSRDVNRLGYATHDPVRRGRGLVRSGFCGRGRGFGGNRDRDGKISLCVATNGLSVRSGQRRGRS
jgi:hypothetical protein